MKMKKLIFALTLIASLNAAAATDVWKGTGELFNLQGRKTGSYALTVENEKQGDVTLSKITVTLPDGKSERHQCRITGDDDGWHSDCDHGQGGGRCYGEGLCESYVADGNGRAFATTMVFDGPEDMRLLRTELKDGKAVRIFREKLHKQ